METSSFADDLRRYFGLVRQWAWLLVLVTLLAAGIMFVISRRSTPIYQATTTVLINQAPADKTTDYSSLVTSERLAQTYSQLMTKQPVLHGVIERLSLSESETELKQLIQVQPVRDTTLIEVRVENPLPQLAADIANALVSEFSEQNQSLQASRYTSSKDSLATQMTQIDQQIQEATQTLANLSSSVDAEVERNRLETILAQYRQTYAYLLQSYEQIRLAEAQSTSNVIQAEPATRPERPVRPRTLANTLLGGAVGLLLALGGIFLIEAMDDTLQSPEQVTRELGLPILGLIAHHATGDEKPMTQLEPRSAVSEAFRSLRTNIQFASVDQPLHTLLITSPSPAEGKSTVAANLAVVLAQSGKRVALVDADLRRPRIHKILDLPNHSGVSDLFVQAELSLDGALRQGQTEGLLVITAGETPPNPAELLGSERMIQILQAIAEQVDVIVLDTPPVLAVTDSAVLAPRVDGVLLVLKPNVTQMAAARQTVEQLRRVGARVLGVVLNQVDLKKSRYQYYYKGYYYASRDYYGRDGRNGGWRKAKVE